MSLESDPYELLDDRHQAFIDAIAELELETGDRLIDSLHRVSWSFDDICKIMKDNHVRPFTQGYTTATLQSRRDLINERKQVLVNPETTKTGEVRANGVDVVGDGGDGDSRDLDLNTKHLDYWVIDTSDDLTVAAAHRAAFDLDEQPLRLFTVDRVKEALEYFDPESTVAVYFANPRNSPLDDEMIVFRESRQSSDTYGNMVSMVSPRNPQGKPFEGDTAGDTDE